MIRVLIHFRLRELRWQLPDESIKELRTRFPGVEFLQPTDDQTARQMIETATVFFGWTLPEELFSQAKELRWFQSASAGVDDSLYPALRSSGIVITNSAGVHAVNVAEHGLAMILALARNLHLAAALKAEGRWGRTEVINGTGGLVELEGARVLVVGMGAIGRALSFKLKALGAQVTGIRRSGRQVAGIACYPPSEIDRLLPEADFVVLIMPLNRETRGFMSAERLAMMKPTAYLVNLARGEVVDEAALIRALSEGRIAAAALDVFSEEPLPRESPLWRLGNVLITPHMAGASPGYFRRVVTAFADNLERFMSGQPMKNVVDPELGYAPEA